LLPALEFEPPFPLLPALEFEPPFPLLPALEFEPPLFVFLSVLAKTGALNAMPTIATASKICIFLNIVNLLLKFLGY
jgi:hypothetical protein